ncbi:protein-export chaperone SecB [Enterococcus faecalis]|uniref:protein-export chaperone SecB n=1 Tax=Enterococcus faecalis TaxID=1351 RepID=UPI00045969B7|nr:protein-export chaperone SecB [Enterococcus faecalis]EHB5047655.1 preprotein translocase subunit SecB [Enterococcus faecalis]EHM3180431.1 protein-export chaperone SecB [Enterococcus faecalis]EIX0512966.1 protein-export chaperone SecB [Enterococcus faecalis]EIY5964643.1 protein-export chaperone SecB [Enterococcus faecalis]EIY7146501.1 protein-export chaperone SecB [Enterococcus faecalis]
MAKIAFKEYYLDKITYKENENYNQESENPLKISTNFNSDILFSKDNVLVSIEAELGDFDDEDCPFKLEVSLNGYFKYTVDKDDSKDVEQLKQLVTQNALAILYPYLRNVVSDVTLKSNRFPAYILPVMNIAELMKKNDSIKIYDIGDLKSKD